MLFEYNNSIVTATRPDCKTGQKKKCGKKRLVYQSRTANRIDRRNTEEIRKK